MINAWLLPGPWHTVPKHLISAEIPLAEYLSHTLAVSVAPERCLGPACLVCPCQYQLGPACPCPYLPSARELPNTHTPNCHSSSHTFYTTHPYLASFQLKLSFSKLCLTDPYGSQSPQVVICTFSSRNGLLLPIECEDHL